VIEASTTPKAHVSGRLLEQHQASATSSDGVDSVIRRPVYNWFVEIIGGQG
jgi:hypothetical protein